MDCLLFYNLRYDKIFSLGIYVYIILLGKLTGKEDLIKQKVCKKKEKKEVKRYK